MEIEEDDRSPVNAVAFSPDGKRLAFADSNGVGFWDLSTGRLDGRILSAAEDESEIRPEVIAYSQDGGLLAGNNGNGEGA